VQYYIANRMAINLAAERNNATRHEAKRREILREAQSLGLCVIAMTPGANEQEQQKACVGKLDQPNGKMEKNALFDYFTAIAGGKRRSVESVPVMPGSSESECVSAGNFWENGTCIQKRAPEAPKAATLFEQYKTPIYVAITAGAALLAWSIFRKPTKKSKSKRRR